MRELLVDLLIRWGWQLVFFGALLLIGLCGRANCSESALWGILKFE